MRISDLSSDVCSSDLKPQDGSGAERRGSAGRVAVLLDGGTRLLCPGPQDRVLPAIAGLPRPEHRAVARDSAGRGELGRSPSVPSGGCGRPPRTRCPLAQSAEPRCLAVAPLPPIGEETRTSPPGGAGEAPE